MGWRHAEGIRKSRNLSSAAVQCLNYSPAHLSLRKTPDTCPTNVYKRNPLHNSCQETIERNNNRDKNVACYINCSEKKKPNTHRQVLVVENFIQCNCVSRSLVLHTGDHGPDSFPVGTPLMHIRSVSISLYDGREVAFTAGYTLSPSHTSPSVFTVLSTPYPQSSRMQYSAVRRHFHSTNVTPTIIQHTKVLCRAKVQAWHQQSCSIQKFCVEPSSSVTLIIHDARVAVYPHTLLTTLITHYSCRSEGYPLLILYTVVTFSTSPYRSPLFLFFLKTIPYA